MRALLACACLALCVWSCSQAADGDGRERAVVVDTCRTTDDCILAQARCCDQCWDTERPYFAQTRSQLQRYVEDECLTAKCGPPLVLDTPGQLRCPAAHDTLTAVCEQNACTTLDLSVSPFAACERDDQCHLRFGADCCPDCALTTSEVVGVLFYAGGLVALSDEAGFLAAYCQRTARCDRCAPDLPNEVTARCIAGHCQVAYDGSALTFR